MSRGRIGSGFEIAARLTTVKNIGCFTCSYPASSLLLFISIRVRFRTSFRGQTLHITPITYFTTCSRTFNSTYFRPYCSRLKLLVRTCLACSVAEEQNPLICSDFIHKSLSNLDLNSLCNCKDIHISFLPPQQIQNIIRIIALNLTTSIPRCMVALQPGDKAN